MNTPENSSAVSDFGEISSDHGDRYIIVGVTDTP